MLTDSQLKSQVNAMTEIARDNTKALRVIRGLTQAEAAERCGMDVARWREFEGGKYTPRLETLVKIAYAIRCEPRQLFEPQFVGPLTELAVRCSPKKVKRSDKPVVPTEEEIRKVLREIGLIDPSDDLEVLLGFSFGDTSQILKQLRKRRSPGSLRKSNNGEDSQADEDIEPEDNGRKPH